MNETTRRALLGAGLLAAGLLGRTQLGGASTPTGPGQPTTGKPSSSSTTSKPTSATPTQPEVPEAKEGFLAWTRAEKPVLRPAGTNPGEPVRTAHHDLAISGHATVERLTLSEVSNLEGSHEAVRAPEGSEFICVQFQANAAPWGPDNRATLELAVGGKLVKLGAPFGNYNSSVGEYTIPSRGLVLLAKKDETVFLRITDVGKVALYDLRAGKRGTDGGTASFNGFLTKAEVVSNTPSGVWSQPFRTTSSKFVTENDTLRFQVDGEFSTRLVPWSPSKGWAPAKHLWLQITLTPQYLYSDKPQRALNPNCTLDLSRSYLLTPNGTSNQWGQSSAGKVQGRDYVISYDKKVTVTWAVPEGMTSATLDANLSVTNLVVNYTNGSTPAKFTAAAKVPRFNLTVNR